MESSNGSIAKGPNRERNFLSDWNYWNVWNDWNIFPNKD